MPISPGAQFESYGVDVALNPSPAPGDAAMTLADDVDYSAVSRSELAGMLRAGEQVLLCQQVLAKTKNNVVSDLLKDQGTFYLWNMYPDGGVSDTETGSHYYYHAHPAEERPGEHGHFHTFLRQSGNTQPTLHSVPGSLTQCEAAASVLSHVVAIEMDSKGNGTKLFNTNRWVTGEAWCESGEMSQMLTRFNIGHARPSWTANLWVTNMLALFRLHIKLLLHARDKVIADWQEKYPGDDVFEDRRLGITAEMAIDVERQVGAIRKALAARGDAANARMSDAAVAQLHGEVQSLRKQLVAQRAKAKLRRREMDAEWQTSEARLKKNHERQIQVLRDAFATKVNDVVEQAERRAAERIESKLSDARAQWESEVDHTLRALQQENERALTDARKIAAAEAREQLLRDKERLLSDAAEDWAREERERLVAAKAQWAIHQQGVLVQRDRRWQAKLERQLHDTRLAIRTEGARTTQISASRADAGQESQRLSFETKPNKIVVRTLVVASLFLLASIGFLYYFPATDPVVRSRIGALMAEVSAGADRLIGLEGPTVVRPTDLAPSLSTIFIRSSVANLRVRPSLQAPVIGKLSRGNRVERLESAGDWVRIRVADAKGTTAWVHASLLSDNQVR